MNWIVSSPENIVAFLKKEMRVTHSGKMLRRLLEANFCRVNGKIERFGSVVLKKGDRVSLAPGWDGLSVKKEAPLTLLYENPDFLIVDKPAGWICDEAHCRKSFGSQHFLVHRLDKGTTGALIIAKGNASKEALMELFAERRVEKQYWALVDGLPKEDEGVYQTHLIKKKSYEGQTIWGSSTKGALAITAWRVVARGDRASWIECFPKTGRTHQIRVHMAEMGHPLLVDRQYAKQFRSHHVATRPLLHAKRLKFTFQGEEIEINAPLPEDFSSSLRLLIPQADTFL